jgi:hypothetical protein
MDGVAHFDPGSVDVRLVRALTTRGATGGMRKLDVACAMFWPAPALSPLRIIMGRSYRRQESHARLRFLKMLRAGVYSFSLVRLYASGCELMATWQYSIVLYPRHSLEQSNPDPLLEEEVLLTLPNAKGVVPRSQTPPRVTYAQIERQPSMPPRHFAVDTGLVTLHIARAPAFFFTRNRTGLWYTVGLYISDDPADTPAT